LLQFLKFFAHALKIYNTSPANLGDTMNLSPGTISLCLELLSGVSVPVTMPDAEAKMRSLVTARQELLAALPGGVVTNGSAQECGAGASI
jgi:hypothetical protein